MRFDDNPPAAVLADSPPEVRACTWTMLPSGGGFSGGRVWRGDKNGTPRFALKRWQRGVTAERLRQIHRSMNAVSDFEFTPKVVGKVLTHENQNWDLTTWRPGTPDLLQGAASFHLQTAGRTLAHLHRVWLPERVDVGPCFAFARRARILARWESTRFRFVGTPAEVTEMASSLEVVRTRYAVVRKQIVSMSQTPGRKVGVHGDFWPENILFQHDRLTAVLDFSNVGFDHPEVDLGRLFADVPAVDRPMISAAVEAYNAAAPFDLSVALVEELATTGRLCSLANWHLRLNAESPDAGLLTAALPRVRRLVSLVRSAEGL